ncbi:MAG TPA: NAD-dependent epimerase/dehydratase family protein [Gemmatimonadaceae bacterium]|nr:NAD-dependent epimerase/dehydratase family protein [Gemmatimonadaceae bacterium]
MTHSGDAFRGRKALVTGGAGFIGSALAIRLVDLGAAVTVADNFTPTSGANAHNLAGIADRAQIRDADIRDAAVMRELVAGQDFLFNLAAQTSHMDSMTAPDADLDINCRAQLSIVELCRCVNPDVKIVYASTRQMYGRPEYLPVDERHPLRPVDVNGINKMAGEWYHILYHQVYGLRTCALRLTNTMGPRMRVKDARQMFVGYWVRCVLEGKPFEVWGGDQRRDISYVDDTVDAFLLAAASDAANGRVFNVGGDRPVTLRELAQLLVAANGGGEYVVREFPRDRQRIEIGDYYADTRSIAAALGWSARVALPDALDRTLHFYREHLQNYV